MALSVPRQRRPRAEDQGASSSSSSSSERYSKVDKGEKKEERAGVGWFLPALLVGLLRHMSASSNIIHDCDEVFNYWEPLRYLLYKSGFQTWEYRNGFNNFNFCFVLALLFVAFVPVARRKYGPELLFVVSPMYIWLAFMSLQAHKEERFLYPIYPLICIAATAVIDSFPDLFRDKYAVEDSLIVMIAKGLRPIFLGLILCASHSRTFSILNGYSAPLEIYKHLDHHDVVGNETVLCIGSEWHRYPSSFFVPSYVKEVQWIDEGFRGLLPFPFNSSWGGMAAAPPHFNDKNKASSG